MKNTQHMVKLQLILIYIHLTLNYKPMEETYMSFYVTTGYFYHALYSPLSQNIQVQITRSNTSSFQASKRQLLMLERIKWLEELEGCMVQLTLSSAVIEYDTPVSYFCSCYMHIMSLLQFCSLSSSFWDQRSSCHLGNPDLLAEGKMQKAEPHEGS